MVRLPRYRVPWSGEKRKMKSAFMAMRVIIAMMYGLNLESGIRLIESRTNAAMVAGMRKRTSKVVRQKMIQMMKPTNFVTPLKRWRMLSPAS